MNHEPANIFGETDIHVEDFHFQVRELSPIEFFWLSTLSSTQHCKVQFELF